MIRYRPEIDGLRALAVLPVMLYHAALPGFSGGYVGVDVFFVISGYLISGIILSDLDKDRFSILNFYERRIRRILPALFVTLLISTIIAWLVFLPRDFKEYAQSLVATVSFTSNFLLMRDSGYFDSANEFRPLLHSWSLAIEEQYYIFFPPLIALLWRWARAWMGTILLVVLLISFAWSIHLSATTPAHAYYGLGARIWELLIGVHITLMWRAAGQAGQARPLARLSDMGADLLCGVGLALIAYAVVAFDAQTAFPGPFAALPAIGTALILLAARPGGAVHRLLSARPLVGIGLISYSAYLFHQPALAFLRYLRLEDPTMAMRVAILVFVLVLAWLSWRFVEAPFRHRDWPGRRRLFSGAALTAMLFLSVGMVGHLRHGYVRFDHDAQSLARVRSLERSGLPECVHLDDCLTHAPDARDVLLFGDSHAFHFSQPLTEDLARQDRRLISLTRGGCFPSPEQWRGDKSAAFNTVCRQFYGEVFARLEAPEPLPDVAILSAAWAAYYYGDAYFAGHPQMRGHHNNARVYPGPDFTGDDQARRAALRDQLRATIKALSDRFRRVCLVAPIPYTSSNFRGGLPAVMAGIGGFERAEFLSETAELLAEFDPAQLPENVRVIYPHEPICADGHCRTERDGAYIYSDATHLSEFGAREVIAPLFAAHPECLSPDMS